MPKLYSHVDESGQNTKGDLFVVGIVNIYGDRDTALRQAEVIEELSGKGRYKWVRIPQDRKLAYINLLLATSLFKGCLYYAVYTNTLDFAGCTMRATAAAIQTHAPGARANIRIDGLADTLRNNFAVELRDKGILTGKIRGINDQGDVLVRMADALCGIVNAALTGDITIARLLKRAEENGFIIKI